MKDLSARGLRRARKPPSDHNKKGGKLYVRKIRKIEDTPREVKVDYGPMATAVDGSHMRR